MFMRTQQHLTRGFLVFCCVVSVATQLTAPPQRRRWMTSTGLLQPTADLGINAAAFSPDGKLAAISQREKLTLLEVESRKARWSLPVQQGKITALVFSPDGNRLISFISSYSKVSPLGKSLLRTILVQTLDIRTGRIEKEITQVEADAVEHAAFSSDGTLFGVATRGNSAIFLWNVTSGRMTPVLLKEEFGEISAAFSWQYPSAVQAWIKIRSI